MRRFAHPPAVSKLSSCSAAGTSSAGWFASLLLSLPVPILNWVPLKLKALTYRFVSGFTISLLTGLTTTSTLTYIYIGLSMRAPVTAGSGRGVYSGFCRSSSASAPSSYYFSDTISSGINQPVLILTFISSSHIPLYSCLAILRIIILTPKRKDTIRCREYMYYLIQKRSTKKRDIAVCNSRASTRL